MSLGIAAFRLHDFLLPVCNNIKWPNTNINYDIVILYYIIVGFKNN